MGIPLFNISGVKHYSSSSNFPSGPLGSGKSNKKGAADQPLYHLDSEGNPTLIDIYN